jgi:hypothetical protein
MEQSALEKHQLRKAYGMGVVCGFIVGMLTMAGLAFAYVQLYCK